MRGMTLLLVCLLLGTWAGTAEAGSLRCAGRLVQVGDSTAEVLSKCGSPTTRDQRTDIRNARGIAKTVAIENWLYNLGPHDFVRILTFVDGVLRRIDLGDYGT